MARADDFMLEELEWFMQINGKRNEAESYTP